MKNILFQMSLMLLVLLATSSCKKDKEPATPDDLPVGSMIAKIDSTDFEATFSATADIESLISFKIKGRNSDSGENGETLTLSMIVGALEPGASVNYTEDCNLNGFICVGTRLQVNSDSGINYFTSDPTEGGFSSFEFTELNYESGGIVKGVFSANLVDDFGESKSLTDGKFHLKID